MTDMVEELDGTLAAEEVGITEAMLWPLLMVLASRVRRGPLACAKSCR